MKILPFIRIALAVALVVSFMTTTGDFGMRGLGLFVNVIFGLFVFTFSLYCLIMALQDWKDKQLINAGMFTLFGIFYQIILFGYGFYAVFIAVDNNIPLWRMTLVVFYEIALTALIFVDIRRTWMNSK